MDASEQVKPADEGRIERRVRPPLSASAKELLETLIAREPLLRLAWNQRCGLKWDCERGPFGCKCGRKIR